MGLSWSAWRLNWRRLPRDARDTLFLLAVIAWTVLPHLSHLPLWCALLSGAVLLWRGRLALVNAALPGRWVVIAVLVLAAGLTLWSHRTLFGKDAGVTMAVALMALKTLELRARRDAFVVFFLGFFLILTHFLYSQSMAVAAAMLVSVWGLLTSLVLANMPVGRPSLKRAGALAARTALLGVPLMVLMFALFPRMGPLWGIPKDGATPTGLSNSMRLGSVAEVAQDDSITMRIRFIDAAPPASALYFRGPVLAQFDGIEWRPLTPSFEPAVTPRADLRVRGPAIRYEATLEPLRLNVLPTLEATTSVADVPGYRVTQRDDLQWTVDRPVFERVRFEAQAQMSFRHGPQQAVLGLQDHLDLPPGYNPRTLAWAAELRRDPLYASADPRTLAQAVMGHIRRGGYSYTLTPGLYGEADPRSTIDEFWLDRKLGFCEHFASAFVVVMRALDVPSRIVTGYQGADPLPVDGYTIVRQRYAHAWAEYWQPNEGWVRADPTSAVAPDRIARTLSLLPTPGFVASALDNIHPALMEGLRLNWETLNNRWNQWVMNYSRGQQVDLLKRLGFASPAWEDMALLLIGAFSSLALAGALWAWWDRNRVDPWVRQMAAVRAALLRLGIAASAFEAPRTLAQRVRCTLAEPGAGLAGLLDTLDAQRYGRASLKRPDSQLTRRFVAAARQVRRR